MAERRQNTEQVRHEAGRVWMQCPACGAEFSSQRELNDHERQVHRNETHAGSR